MSSEELITKQAEMVLAADPGITGEGPRVWAYRNTIKALNWYGIAPREDLLEDPAWGGATPPPIREGPQHLERTCWRTLHGLVPRPLLYGRVHSTSSVTCQSDSSTTTTSLC